MSGQQRRRKAIRMRCRYCGKRTDLRASGAFVTHRAGGGRVCPGSHKLPGAAREEGADTR